MTKQSNACLILLGSPFSGLSTLAGCLDLMGVDTGARAAKEPQENGLILTHDLLMRDLGCHWDMVGAWPRNWLESDAAGQARKRLFGIIEEHFLHRGPWAAVDPRMTRLMPLWTDVLTSLNITPHPVFLLRHPLEVAGSLETNHRLDPDKGHLLWMVHCLEALRGCRDHDHAVVVFDELLADPPGTLQSMLEHLGMDSPIPLSEASREIEEFIRPEIRRHHAGGPGGPDSASYAHYAGVYDQIRFGLSHQPGPSLLHWINADPGAGIAVENTLEIVDDLMSWVGRGEQREWDWRLKKERLLVTAPPAETIFCRILVQSPDSLEEADAWDPSEKVLLPLNEWQRIEVEISRPELLRTNRLRLEPLNTRGVAVLAAVQLIHAATGEICWGAPNEAGFSGFSMERDGFMVGRGDNLVVVCTGDEPRVLLPLLPDLPNAPMRLQLWIKADSRQTELLTLWEEHTEARVEEAGKLAALQAQWDQAQKQLKEHVQALADKDRTFAAEKAEWEKKLEELRRQHRAREAEWEKKVEELRRQHQAGEAEWERKVEALSRAREEARSEAEELRQQLQAGEAEWDSRSSRMARELGIVTRMLEEQQGKQEKVFQHFLWSMKNPITLPVVSSKKKRFAKQRLEETVQMVKDHGLVNEAWYLERYPDVAEAGHDAVEHYVKYGFVEGRAPGPEFE